MTSCSPLWPLAAALAPCGQRAGGRGGATGPRSTRGALGHGFAAQVWGSLADEESLALAQKLVGGKISPSVKPGQMRILDEPVRFTVHGASTAQPVA